ncbi:MAG: hypothetical protein FJX36_14430 [Alphaproteobacteria bacterium]|nr:hypothetical protein [Alphaproteobacteria bacterium]
MTEVGRDHVEHLGGPDAMAHEIGKLVAAVPAHGLAVLNADDPRVRTMAGLCRGRVVTFGLAEGADYRAMDIVDGWPERLAFTVVAGDRRCRVQTRLCGEQWVRACLGALATADGLGVPLEDAAYAIGRTEPIDRRMKPHERPDGIAFIIVDFKCSFLTIAPALAYMARARAQRKIVVMGTISDYEGDPRCARHRPGRAGRRRHGSVRRPDGDPDPAGDHAGRRGSPAPHHLQEICARVPGPALAVRRPRAGQGVAPRRRLPGFRRHRAGASIGRRGSGWARTGGRD